VTLAAIVAVSLASGASSGATAARPRLALERAPVQQLPPGHVTLGRVKTPQGTVAVTLHRIRYRGKVSLCMSESNGASSGQSCATYPLGPKSDQGIGSAPVWWTTYVGVCTSRHFQVISGVVIRSGLTAWLRTPAGLARMPTATVPGAFHVTGPLLYAIVARTPATVTLRNADGKIVYSGTVARLTGIPTAHCHNGSASTAIGISVTSPTGGAVIP
jgi:hypothetical protein